MVKKKNKLNIEIVNKNSSPEARLSVLRAKQLIGKVDPNEYENTRQEVIEGLHPKTKALWLKLERNYDCEVCELFWESKAYGFKIRTPYGTFLDYATEKELIEFMDELYKDAENSEAENEENKLLN